MIKRRLLQLNLVRSVTTSATNKHRQFLCAYSMVLLANLPKEIHPYNTLWSNFILRLRWRYIQILLASERARWTLEISGELGCSLRRWLRVPNDTIYFQVSLSIASFSNQEIPLNDEGIEVRRSHLSLRSTHPLWHRVPPDSMLPWVPVEAVFCPHLSQQPIVLSMELPDVLPTGHPWDIRSEIKGARAHRVPSQYMITRFVEEPLPSSNVINMSRQEETTALRNGEAMETLKITSAHRYPRHTGNPPVEEHHSSLRPFPIYLENDPHSAVSFGHQTRAWELSNCFHCATVGIFPIIVFLRHILHSVKLSPMLIPMLPNLLQYLVPLSDASATSVMTNAFHNRSNHLILLGITAVGENVAPRLRFHTYDALKRSRELFPMVPPPVRGFQHPPRSAMEETRFQSSRYQDSSGNSENNHIPPQYFTYVSEVIRLPIFRPLSVWAQRLNTQATGLSSRSRRNRAREDIRLYDNVDHYAREPTHTQVRWKRPRT